MARTVRNALFGRSLLVNRHRSVTTGDRLLPAGAIQPRCSTTVVHIVAAGGAVWSNSQDKTKESQSVQSRLHGCNVVCARAFQSGTLCSVARMCVSTEVAEKAPVPGVGSLSTRLL